MIYIVTPGGTSEKGGMGRIVDNFTSDLRKNCPDLAFEVVDTYGPGNFYLMPFYYLKAMVYLATRFATGRAQLVHIHMAEYGSVLRKGLLTAMCTLFRVPVVLHLHGGRFPKQYDSASSLMRWPIRRMMKMTREVVVLGDFWKDWVESRFGDDVERVTLLHNAVHGPSSRPELPRNHPVRLLTLGRLIPLKAIDVLLNALATDECRKRDWHLTIAGDGDIATYRAQAEQLGLSDRVHFTGWLDQTGCQHELKAADILVQPSLFEGLPMSVLEAMSNALAIIATPVGSVGDAIIDEETGLLVPPKDVDALAHALVRVIDSPELRQRLGTGAFNKFRQQFEISVYRTRLIEIYQRNARHPARFPSIFSKTVERSDIGPTGGHAG